MPNHAQLPLVGISTTRDRDGRFFDLGIDKRLSENTVAGRQFGLDRTALAGLDRALTRDTHG